MSTPFCLDKWNKSIKRPSVISFSAILTVCPPSSEMFSKESPIFSKYSNLMSFWIKLKHKCLLTNH